jgi:hypothetical protein
MGKRLSLLPILLVALAMGCKPSSSTSATSTGTPGPTPPVDGGAQAKADLKLPEELRHEGFRYFGVEGRKDLVLEMVSSASKDVSTGSQQFELEAVENGEARYRQTWTGGLNALGASVIAVRKDGVYTVENAGREVTPAQLELPADPQAGYDWSGSSSFFLPGGQKVSQQTKLNVVGQQKVKTKAGEFDALVVKVKGTLDMEGKKSPVDMTYWYVRDMGPVKVEFSSVVEGKPAKVTIQAVK